jgi:hypothetical protein
MPDGPYRVFISHGSRDSWVAAQLAKAVRAAGALPFLDETDIAKGANFKKRIQEEIELCHELIALFTPWSAQRSWVWVEMGAAWSQEKPIIAIFYGMQPSNLEASGQGTAIIEDINVVDLNDVETYIKELTSRVQGSSK